MNLRNAALLAALAIGGQFASAQTPTIPAPAQPLPATPTEANAPPPVVYAPPPVVYAAPGVVYRPYPYYPAVSVGIGFAPRVVVGGYYRPGYYYGYRR